MISTNELVTTSRGLQLECDPEDEVITKSLRETGQWEELVARAIDDYLEPGWTFLDLGAHIGIFSVQAAKKGNPVIAVEASPEYVRLLWENLRINECFGATMHGYAVSDYEGAGFLKRDARFARNPGASYLGSEGEPVEVKRLSSLLGDTRPEFIKADIEGLEYRVLKDNPEILDAAQILIVEVGREMCAREGHTPGDVVNLLREHGFGVTFMDGSPLDERFDALGNDHYTNLLARRGFVEQPVKITETPAPVRGTVILCAWRNLLAETAECMLMLRDRGWGYTIKRGDALISRSRSIAVSHWYRLTDEEVFLMIDDDVVFAPEHAESVVRLAKEKRSIVCGAYPVKDGTHLACRRFPGQTVLFGDGQPPVEIVYPATGFMAVHRDVINAMVEAKNEDGSPLFPLCDINGLSPMWPFFDCFTMTDDNGHNEYLSEDYAFGEQARRLGFKVWLDPTVILYHMGFYPYTIENMKNTFTQEQPS